jgi:hypothetical protein
MQVFPPTDLFRSASIIICKCTGKSPLTPLCQRGEKDLPLKKGGREGFD